MVASCSWVGLMNNHPADTKYVYVPPPEMTANTDPYMAKTVECKVTDFKIQPCHRLEKGKFELVLSFAPLRVIPLNVCAVEDGGPKLPCIWQDTNDQDKKTDPITRNVFWKGKL